jgi:fructose/tagatose bisphosphate aldolase
MIFDRGSIKWASLMLPEHVKALREWRDDEKEPKAGTPVFDDQTNDTFDRILQQAIETRTPLSITFVEGGRKHIAKGIVTKLDYVNEIMTIREHTEKTYKIPIDHIIQMN